MTSERLLKAVIQMAALSLAIGVSLSRITDNMHHWSDVAGGVAIGVIIAVLVVSPVLCPVTKRCMLYLTYMLSESMVRVVYVGLVIIGTSSISYIINGHHGGYCCLVDKYKRQINTFDSIKDWKYFNLLLPTHKKLDISF